MAQTYEKLYIESILVNFAIYRDSQPNLTEILGKLEKNHPQMLWVTSHFTIMAFSSTNKINQNLVNSKSLRRMEDNM